MVAAYLVGTRGAARHAIALGLTVTVTHTIGVFALALVTLSLSQYVLPEQLYPWRNLASGLLVVLLGAVARHQVALGLVLAVAFSAGLATTLVALGLALTAQAVPQL